MPFGAQRLRLLLATVATVGYQFNLFSSSRIDAINITEVRDDKRR